MLFNKHNLAVAKFCSKTKFGKSIEGVYFDKDKTVATDGFRLIEITTPEGDIADYPMIKDYEMVREAKTFIIEGIDVASFKTPKAFKSLPILENVVLAEKEDRIALLSTDLKTTNAVIGRKITEAFPDYERLFSKEKPLAEVTLNGKYLSEILATLSGLDKFKTVTIKIFAENKPIEVYASGKGQKGRALVMPMNK